MKLNTLFIFLCLSKFCFAQSDTSIVYLAKDAHETTKDSAYSLIKFYQQNNMWHGKEYYLKNSVLKSEGEYGDKSVKNRIGNFNNYTENGKLDFTTAYNNGKLNEVTYYYKSGSKKSWAVLDDKGGVKQQKGWDESGKEIKNFVVMREASFKGGPEGWKKYLEKNLNANVAADAGAPPGEYTVQVTFKVSAEGYTSNVKVKSLPVKCKPCGSEAVQAIINSREWQPAIFQNEAVEYQAIQFITFVVSESKNDKKN